MLFALQATMVSPKEAIVRPWHSNRIQQQARQAGGILLRGMVLLAVVALGWVWLKSGRKAKSSQNAPVSRPMVQKDGTLIVPVRDESGRPREPMVLIPVSARANRLPERSPASPPPAQATAARSNLVSTVAISNAPAAAGAQRPPFDERVLGAQLSLVRHAISAGSLDGVMGAQTRAAVRAFQQQENLPVTGHLDPATLAGLGTNAPLFTNYTVTAEDLASLQPLGKTWLEKSQQSSLAYETALELVAEKSHSNPKLVRWLNPQVDWDRISAGTSVQVVNSEYPPPEGKAAFVRIFLNDRKLQAFDANSNLLAHFPCSIAARVDKRPLGEELHVAAVAPNPNYTFDPAVFPESAEAQELGRKLILQPGPNNPVGMVWFSLDKPGYGIHGTPRPEDVGRTESHGCFRLANWNAEYLLRLVTVGTPVFVDP